MSDDRDDLYSWGRSDSAALGGLLALAGWTLLGLLVSCCGPAPRRDDLADRVYVAATDAWEAHSDLPPLSDREPYCGHLDLFEVVAPPTPELYARSCPERSWACLDWRLLPGRVRSLYYPVAVLSPALPVERRAAGASHELLHALSVCGTGREDHYHLDRRVWETGGPGSVESRAEAALY